MTDRARDTATYLIGYAVALALTIAAFAAVRWWHVGSGRVFAAVLILGLAQATVQFRCFFNIRHSKAAHPDVLLLLFSSTIMTLMVSGTLIIIFNLRDRMM